MRWALDEMLPPAAAEHLKGFGHDAVSVALVGMSGATDEDLFTWAVAERRIIVTENVADFAVLMRAAVDRGGATTAVVLVRKSSLPRGGALGLRLAERLDRWAANNPEPYLGLHWLSGTK